ncbi:P-type conjugative transfer protein TrbG [Caballeronia sp. CLC5]|uniref:P-type conjugative transfer protein TrbG n=1 Tax=Caballeronia sp. CLC5 TaxID=2906764 RepID=UPI001F41D23E|nr:P-type conjugative transfer protein TrbG [Caballeronia sp. CLC5]MCE4568641.1 P-type conjugative transfer protein TrbG [Caballeronia sp. CLC5]
MTHTPFRRSASAVLLVSATALAGCATASAKPPSITYDDPPREIAATPAAEPPRPVEVVTIPEPLPLPGQLKPVAAGRRLPSPPIRAAASGSQRRARIQPTRDGYVNAIQQYPWTEGALYQVYAAPGPVTDIALQEGEQLVGPGPVAAGDTVRWIIGDTVSGSGATARVHILVKPTRPDLFTNLIINTSRRTYHLELRATASTYMASVSWTYPQDALIALRGANAAAASAAPVASGLDLAALNFRYRIEGDRVAWRPARAFDDGRQVFVEFPAGISQGEMPPLFVTGLADDAELVNYRVQGRYMVVDRLFTAAELRLGDRRSERRVRIVRDGAEPRRRGR